jgi:hypothetical protein
MRVPFGANNAWAAAHTWAYGVRLGLDAERRHPGRVLTVRYEELVQSPVERVPQICEFLGLEYAPDMLAIERTDASKISKDQSGWFTNVWAGINTSSVGRWRHELSPRDQRVFAAVAGAELAALGYETGPANSDVRGARLYAAHDLAMRAANFVRLRVVQERGRELRYVLQRKLRGVWV